MKGCVGNCTKETQFEFKILSIHATYYFKLPFEVGGLKIFGILGTNQIVRYEKAQFGKVCKNKLTCLHTKSCLLYLNFHMVKWWHD